MPPILYRGAYLPLSWALAIAPPRDGSSKAMCRLNNDLTVTLFVHFRRSCLTVLSKGVCAVQKSACSFPNESCKVTSVKCFRAASLKEWPVLIPLTSQTHLQWLKFRTPKGLRSPNFILQASSFSSHQFIIREQCCKPLNKMIAVSILAWGKLDLSFPFRCAYVFIDPFHEIGGLMLPKGKASSLLLLAFIDPFRAPGDGLVGGDVLWRSWHGTCLLAIFRSAVPINYKVGRSADLADHLKCLIFLREKKVRV